MPLSEIIPFPRSKEKLIKDIKAAFHEHKFDRVYELFENYEKHFELDEHLAHLKCQTLYELEHFLELREETVILLKQGFDLYDEMMVFYVKSLNGLGQYFEVVQVIDQVIDEVRHHQTRMQLFPIKEYAMSQIEHYNRHSMEQLKQFDQLQLSEQIQTILTLIDYSQYTYKETVAHLIETLSLHPQLQSMMLEYLRFAKYDRPVALVKYDERFTVTPKSLPGLENTTMKRYMIPKVLAALENDTLQLIEEANRVMNHHSILLYPMEITDKAQLSDWVKAYTAYFQSMLGLTQISDEDQLLAFIRSLDQT